MLSPVAADSLIPIAFVSLAVSWWFVNHLLCRLTTNFGPHNDTRRTSMWKLPPKNHCCNVAVQTEENPNHVEPKGRDSKVDLSQTSVRL